MSRVTFRPAWSISGSLLLCQPCKPGRSATRDWTQLTNSRRCHSWILHQSIIYAAGFHEVGREVVAEESSAS
jgi:hypothetical protein